MKLSLKNKFLWPTIALIILGMGLSAGISSLWSGRALKNAITDQIAGTTQSTVEMIDVWVKGRVLEVKSWSRQKNYQTALQQTFVGKAARKSANETLKKIKEEYGYYENICLANTSGEILAAADSTIIGKEKMGARGYHQKSIGGTVAISEVVASLETGHPVFIISAPVYNDTQIAGVLFGVVDMNYFSRQFVDAIKIGETGHAFIFDHKGIVVAHPDKQQVMKTDMKAFPYGKEMMQAEEGLITFSRDGSKSIFHYKRSKQLGWTICVGAATSEFYSPIKRLIYINGLVTAVVVVLASVVILLLVRSIINPINSIVDGLNEGSDKVTSSSHQLSSASHSLAEGSSEQAASIEEASSSLEEMSSMTRQNASNASNANSLMTEANQVVSQANGSMIQLIDSMDEISHASDETQKIVKTIDEIAFQTNLLALNAAVEAARAGEAGAGFAVVADEVRNLAMRAAEAAKNTADLIEGTVHKISTGSDLVDRTNTAFKKVSNSTSKVGELVAEIAMASNEQAQGIEQLNVAVVQMDKVVQANAANSEETASASEEMRAQADQMKTIVQRLVSLVGEKAKTSPRSVTIAKETPGEHAQLANEVNAF